jgi:hypothetical protein
MLQKTQTLGEIAACLFLLIAATARGQEPPFDFRHDFRGKPLPTELKKFQVNQEGLLKFEPQGLRITLPKKYVHPLNGVGVASSTVIHGDFEVTATVEVIDLEPPKGGPGAGVGLSVDAPTKQQQLRRVVGAKGRHSIMWTGYHSPNKKNPEWTQAAAPCAENVLRMRLKRTGTTLHYLWAPGAAGDEFVEVHQQEFGNDDIEHVRLFAMNGRQACLVDVRLLDLRIRIGSDAVAEAAAKSQPAGWLAAVLIVGAGVIVFFACGIVLALLLRRRGS